MSETIEIRAPGSPSDTPPASPPIAPQVGYPVTSSVGSPVAPGLSLVEFQEHLLDLTGSQSDRYADSVVAILLGDDRERWLLDLAHLRAAAVPALLAPAFSAPSWVRGITHIQGRVWTVLDTHHLLRGRPGPSRGGWLTLLFPPPGSDWAADDPRLALWWSDIVEIAPRNRYTPAPAPVNFDPWVLGRWTDSAGNSWSEMDVARLWSPDGVLERWATQAT